MGSQELLILFVLVFVILVPWIVIRDATAKGASTGTAVLWAIGIALFWPVLVAYLVVRSRPDAFTSRGPTAPPVGGATPPPGWYDDPDGGGQRWWDGQRWTDMTQGADRG